MNKVSVDESNTEVQAGTPPIDGDPLASQDTSQSVVAMAPFLAGPGLQYWIHRLTLYSPTFRSSIVYLTNAQRVSLFSRPLVPRCRLDVRPLRAQSVNIRLPSLLGKERICKKCTDIH